MTARRQAMPHPYQRPGTLPFADLSVRFGRLHTPPILPSGIHGATRLDTASDAFRCATESVA